MVKLRPTYSLSDIQVQMTALDMMNLTVSARSGIRAAGMAQADALSVVQGLTAGCFYKSMPCLTYRMQ